MLLQLARRPSIFDSLGQFNGVAQTVYVQRSYPARFSPDPPVPRPCVLQFLGIAFNFTFTDPDNSHRLRLRCHHRERRRASPSLLCHVSP